MGIRNNNKLNLIPVFGDLGTLVLGIFILVIVIQTIQLKEIPKEIEIPTASYFTTGSDALSKKDSLQIDVLIRNKFEGIKQAFIDSNLVNINIEGHTDPDRLTIIEGRFATNNKQLSFMRAERVYQIFENIIKDSFGKKHDKDNFLKKVQLIGHGSKHRKYRYKPLKDQPGNDNKWEVYKRLEDGTDSTMFTNFSSSDSAKKKAFELRRRVEIIPVIKGG